MAKSWDFGFDICSLVTESSAAFENFDLWFEDNIGIKWKDGAWATCMAKIRKIGTR